ncbi:MAG: MiaB/RimO family radical SAM methylthiotransferase [Candidatus Omnitrophota bacterium]
MKSKVGIVSLGCPRNLVDSENILGRLHAKGHSIVDIDKADVAIVNTCGFIEDSKQESVDVILDLIELKKEGKLKKIIVYGCLAQRYKDVLRKELPEVDVFVGRVSLNHVPKRFALTPRHYAYLKICEGCINSCSFCVIPRIKGGFSSLDMDSVIKKVRDFDKERISELNIIGQDITGYGLDLYGRMQLEEVLRNVIKNAKHIGWVRLLYLHPSRVTDELISLIKDSPKLCKYIDIPIQHINDRILKLMHRSTAKQDIMKLIEKIRKKIPGVALRTSIITGFPSETEEEFKELLTFIEEASFERLGAFIYSREEGTPAFDFADQIPEKVKKERLGAVMSLQQDVSRKLTRKFMNRVMDVLIEEKEGASYLGRTEHDAAEVDGLVYVRSKKPLKAGSFVKVKINDTLEYDLVGEAL